MHRFALVFDFDGTLADSLPLCLAANRAGLLRHTGRIFTVGEISAHFGVSEEGIMRRLAPERWEACTKAYLEEYERDHDRLCPAPFPGMRELLARLRARGLMLGLVTGKGAASAEVSLRKLNLGPLFDGVRTGSPESDVKAQNLEALIREFEVGPDRAAYVGDFASDVRAARRAGIKALAAAWAPQVNADQLAGERPDALLRSIGELETWVDAWLARDADEAA
ncbi:MAG TPA: HAD family hydrolase [Anaeromyxobacter sp.]|nr:HAD family hydrolase [Anaeromyxobacter sp.]